MPATRRDIEIARALYAARRRRGFGDRYNARFQPGVVQRHKDIVVTMAASFRPLTVSFHRRRWYVHRTRAVFLAWRRGMLVGMLVIAWCGADLVTATLHDEHEGPPCRRCEISDPTPRTVRILIQLEEV